MSTRPAIVPTYATDATLTGGDEVGLAPRLDPTSAIRSQGFYSNRRLPARCLSWMFGTLGDWIGYFDQNAIHGPLQTWRKVVLTNVNATVYSVLVGVRQNNASGTTPGADAQRMPVVLGQAFGDSNKLYINRCTDGLEGETSPTTISGTTLAWSAGLPAWAGSGSVIVACNGTGTIYTPNSASTWAAWASVSGSNTVGGHYSVGSGTYFFLRGTGTAGGVLHGSALGGAVSLTLLPGSVATTNDSSSEFADDGGSITLMLAHVASNAFPSIFRTIDGGVTWTKVLDLAGTNGNLVYSKSRAVFVAWDTTGQLWSSIDGSGWSSTGATNATSSNGITTGRSSMVAHGPAIVKLCTGGLYGGNGIAYTMDLGATWYRWTIGGYSSVVFRHMKSLNGRLYLVSDDSLWVSAPLSVPSIGDF